MKTLKLMRENEELRVENEKLKLEIRTLHEIIKTEDDCINQLISSTLADVKRRCGWRKFW